jgi:tetratricopeptide (TPR) repeat protein
VEKKIQACFSQMHTPDGTRLSATAEQRAYLYYTRGLLYHLSGKYELAIADYTNAIGWRRSEATYEARGDAYADLGEHDKASADYGQADVLRSDDPDRRKELCRIRALRGHPLDRALTDCTKALNASPDDNDILDTRCLVYFRMTNYKAAIADCTKARSINARDPTALYIEGLAKLRLGEGAESNSDIAAALDADFRVADVYALYGVTR